MMRTFADVEAWARRWGWHVKKNKKGYTCWHNDSVKHNCKNLREVVVVINNHRADMDQSLITYLSSKTGLTYAKMATHVYAWLLDNHAKIVRKENAV